MSFGFRNKLSKIRQVHMNSASSQLSASVGNFVTSFTQNAVSLVETNFNTPITDDDLMKTMDLVEKVGKKRRSEVSTYLESITAQGQPV